MGRYIIKALTGPVKGKIFPVRKGLKIGRTLGDILLKDPLVSDLHAEIEIYSNGKIMIIDKDSKNQIIINNKRIIKSVLEKGSKFKIGETEFEIAFVRTPEEILFEFIEKNTESFQNHPISLKPFFQSIELIFLSGIQKGQRHYLSYGPRFFGAHSVDLPILEKEAPKKAFAFMPDGSGTFFVTDHPKIVHFNGQEIKKTKIKTGDKILIKDTVLKLTLK